MDWTMELVFLAFFSYTFVGVNFKSYSYEKAFYFICFAHGRNDGRGTNSMERYGC